MFEATSGIRALRWCFERRAIEQPKMGRLHSRRLRRELSRLGVLPHFLFDRIPAPVVDRLSPAPISPLCCCVWVAAWRPSDLSAVPPI
jgi:hypothetical protein